MIESRDRLIREEDPLTPMSGRRLSVVGTSRFSPVSGGRNLFGSITTSRTDSVVGFGGGSSLGLMAMAASRNLAMIRVGNGINRLSNGRGRILRASSSSSSENFNPLGNCRRYRGRPKNNGVLPSWYPRTPLRDITAIVNAIERRRVRLREAEDRMVGTPLPQEQSVQDPALSDTGAPLEHDISTASPIPTASNKNSPSTIVPCPKNLLKDQIITSESDFMTPQKKLLNSLDEVEKVVKDELERIKKTPIAKRVEREKKVRVLMAMR